MKTKSTSDNKFRYVSFTEQISKVSVDITRWHSSLASTSAESETYFNDAIVKYREIDFGSFYENFLNDIPYGNGELRTYAQLLHRKDVVGNALIRHLSIVGSTSLVTLLQLTTAFAQDLREDLQSHLWDFLEAIIGLLERSHEDKEILETGFFTLAKIFWLQRRYLVRELREVFRRFKRLFLCKRVYMRRFIAEALAFLFRKSSVIDKLTIFLAETAYKEANSPLVDSVARLYFNALKISKGQFHSTAPQVLLEILRTSLKIEDSSVRDAAVRILEGAMSHCATYASKEHSGSLLQILLEQYRFAVSSSNTANAVAIAKLLAAWVGQKNGRSFHDPSSLFQSLNDILKSADGKLVKEIIELLAVAIVKFHRESELHTFITSAVRTVMNSGQRCDLSLILNFLGELSEIPLFDLWIMPAVGIFTSRMVAEKDVDLDRKVFEFYATLCSKRRPIQLHKAERHSFFDAANHLEVRNRLIEILKSVNEFDVDTVGCCLMVYPWLWRRSENPLEIEAVFAILETSMKTADTANAHLALLAANVIFMFDSNLFSRFTVDELLEYYKNMGSNEAALHVLCLIIPFVESFKELADVTLLSKVANEILPMFGHWSSRVRQVALTVLCHFDVPLNNAENDDGTPTKAENAFHLLCEAERTPLTLGDYRTRLMLLRRLSYGYHIKHMPRDCDTAVETVPLRIIIANLYEHYTILWSQLLDIIETYAYGLNIEIFFSLFFSFVDNATTQVASRGSKTSAGILCRITNLTDEISPDYGMFRLQLFTFLGRISEVVERRTKFLSPILINLFRVEYQRDDPLKRGENITLVSSDLPNTANATMGEEETMENVNADSNFEIESAELPGNEDAETNLNHSEERSISGFFIGRKMVRRTIIALLEVFGNFKAPKTIYMAKEIRELYDQLLLIADEDIQKLAIKCIFSYKYKYLTPYRENFESLVDEKCFRDELVRFTVDDQGSIIDEKHRADVMPILLRLLYGKYNTYVHKGELTRRAAIFRFLAGCSPDELTIFLRLLFAPLLQLAGEGDESLEALCLRMTSTFDASSIQLPLLAIKGSFKSISQIAAKLSPALTDAQKRLLFRLCLAAALLSRLAARSMDLIQPRYVKPIKELRRLACSTFKEVFQAGQDRKFDADELNAFLKFYVGPLCICQNDSAPVAPLSLLRLFLSWTYVPKLFYLLRLQVPLEKGTEQSVLSIVCNMLASKSANEVVKESIIDGVLSLLTLADEEVPDLVPGVGFVEIQEGLGVNSGTAVVLGELPKLLEFIFYSLPVENENRKVNMKHLEVLNRISVFVRDERISERFVSVLLTFLERGAVRSDEAIQSLLMTVSRMVAVTANSEQFLRNLINLQSALNGRQNREALVKVEEAIALKVKVLERRKAELLICVADLDSWDEQRIGEPDHDKRYNAYTTLNQALASNETIEPVLLFLALHNDYHVITQMSDISLRTMAAVNFRNIVEYFGMCSREEHEKQEAVDSHMLRLVLKGLHEEKEVIRHDFVNLLVSLIATFPRHKHLRHLAQLRNTEVDLDFFENVTHMQMHRRQRAFYRLTQSLESKDMIIPNEVSLRFLLPLLQPFVMDVSSKTSALSDASLRLLTQIMRGAPWKKYFPMLDFYMKRLRKEDTNHKAVVRVIVAIVDAFHFDVVDENDVEHESPAKRQRRDDTAGVEESDDEDRDIDIDKGDMVIEVGSTKEMSVKNLKESGRKNALSIQQKVIEYLIPRLKDCATGKDLASHRKAQSGKHYKEDEDVQRAPVALATVKLLQKMPQVVMDQNLQGVVIKMCSLLMSRSVNVREAAGKTLIEIAKTLGPKYLPFIVREMKQNMKKGFQVHVMIFYVHKLLSVLVEQLNSGDLDPCIADIVEVCSMDLFGDVADEKSVTGITKDVPEAKTHRAYETYRLLGRFVSQQSFGNILSSLKEVIESQPNSKTIRKVGRLLRQFSTGISANHGIEPAVALVFVYRVLKEHMAEVFKECKENDPEHVKNSKEDHRPESCLILEKEPTRIGVIVKVSLKSKMHVFIEFGLHELYSVLKSKVFDPELNEDVGRLDPFVDIVLQCLQLKYDQIIINSLRCFILLLKFPLPALRSNMPQFLNRLFILLADYTALGVAGNATEYVRKSLEVSQLVFKALTHVIKDAPNLVLSSKRLQLLLTYVETDVVDNHKQAVAFPLIKAVIIRKLQDPKIVEIIQYLSEMAITSEISHIREQCRQVIALYIGNHPQCRRPTKHVEFFLEQLEYEYEDGRKSAVEMLNVFFERLSEKVNDQYALLAFVKLAMRLVNDESSVCKRMIILAMQQLVKSVSDSKRNDLFLASQDWLKSKKEPHLCIAMQVMVIFSTMNGDKFEKTIQELLPTMSGIIHHDVLFSYAEESIGIIISSFNELLSRHKKRLTCFAVDGLLDSILKEMSFFARCNQSPIVQLSAARFLSLVFSSLDEDYLSLRKDPSARDFMQWTLMQLKTYQISNELAEQAVKNVVYLFDAVVRSDEVLKWLCHRLCLLCKFEVVKKPDEAVRRINVFKLAAAITLKVEPHRSGIVVEALLPSLYREMQGKSAQNTEILQQISKEVAETMKGRIGEEEFTKRMAECQKSSAAKFESRKRKRKEEVILDPVGAARKKLRKNKAKSEASKRISGQKKRLVAKNFN